MPHKRSIVLLIAFYTLVGQITGQCVTEFFQKLNLLPVTERQARVDSFLNTKVNFPLVESDTLVHFIYTGNEKSVALAGDATGWAPKAGFIRLPGTTLWYYSAFYPADSRLDYKLVINGVNWILDPKNTHTCLSGMGNNSELRMPEYIAPPETQYYKDIPHGSTYDTVFQSQLLENGRLVRIYLPPGYQVSKGPYPVILFHDGLDYYNLAQTNNILDYLIDKQIIEPVIALFVPAVERSSEYAGAKMEKFSGFITTELMPVISSHYPISKDPAKRAMAGASDGGNISLFIGMNHPDLFGKISAQSSDVITVIQSTFTTSPKLNLALYIDIGVYDIGLLIPMVHGLRDILREKGYNYQFREWHEGHSWGNWKAHLKWPLVQFFPGPDAMRLNHEININHQ